ncbi:MAG: dihydropteroate synthase [Acidimicrobiales bacterium]|nr:dihydropteroate synthase [Acidimicrobiales bacterium]
MKLHGVINASHDSLADFSIALTIEETMSRAKELIQKGCVGIDIGAAGSTQFADRVDTDEEWSRLEGKIEALSSLEIELSIDTWNPEIMNRALDAGANFMNASDGLQNPLMVDLAAERQVPVVLPFLNGNDPKSLEFVSGDPLETILPWFDETLTKLEKSGIKQQHLILDPGTGFGPADWAWEERQQFQERIYRNLERLRVFGLPVYIALPWKMEKGRRELLDILLEVGFDYGRTHIPEQILDAQKELFEQ